MTKGRSVQLGKRTRLGVSVLALMFLAGCAEHEAPPPPTASVTTPPPAPRKPVRPPLKGTAGPLKYAMVGGYMDAQEKDFRSRLHGVPIMRVGDDIIVAMREDMLFKGDALSPRGRDVIKHLAELLRHYDHSAVQVGGYTDTAQPEDRNRAQSEAHAKSVADQLVSDGLSRGRVSSAGYGSTHLKVATGPGKSEPRNRRVEVRVIAHPEA